MSNEGRRRLIHWLAFAPIVVASYFGLTNVHRVKFANPTARQIICTFVIVVGLAIWFRTGRR